MGDRVAVMRKGELQQVAPPQELYDGPVNVFVGGFIGSPAMNMLEATVERRNGGARAASLGETRLALDEQTLARRPALASYENREIVLGIRPENLEDAALADGDAARGSAGGSELREALGSEVLVHFTIDARRRRSPTTSASSPRTSETTAPSGSSPQGGGTNEATLVGRFSPRTRVARGRARRGRRRPAGIALLRRPDRPGHPRRTRSGLTSRERRPGGFGDRQSDVRGERRARTVDKDRMFMPK